MKKFITTLMMMAVMAVAIPLTANAQTRRYDYNRPNVYQRHRKAFDIGIGTAAGVILGGLIGGKKGALIGAAAGAGGGAIYTYKINPQRRRYYRGY